MIAKLLKDAIQQHVRFWNRMDPDLEAQRDKAYADIEEELIRLIDKRIKRLAKPK